MVTVTIRKTGLIIASLSLVLAFVIGAYAAYWSWRNLGAELLLRDQQASVMIPDPMKVGIDILDDLDIELDTDLETSVPIDQRLDLAIREKMNVEVTLDDSVPIEMDVPLEKTIQLDQKIPIDGEVEAKVLGQWITLPVKGKLPVEADIPIDITVPVEQMVDISFTSPAEVRFLENLSVPLKTDIDTTIPLETDLSVPVRSELDAFATILEPADALIAEMDLQLPIRDIGLSWQPKGSRAEGGLLPSGEPVQTLPEFPTGARPGERSQEEP